MLEHFPVCAFSMRSLALVQRAPSCTPRRRWPSPAGDRRRRADWDHGFARRLAISPDGSAVLFTVRQWGTAGSRRSGRKDARTHVWRVRTDGSRPARQLTFGERGDSQPAWSPDGRYISFVSARGPRDGRRRPEGADLGACAPMAARHGRSPRRPRACRRYAWSPDGQDHRLHDGRPRDQPTGRGAVARRDDERAFEDDFRLVHLWDRGRRDEGRDAGDRAATRSP